MGEGARRTALVSSRSIFMKPVKPLPLAPAAGLSPGAARLLAALSAPGCPGARAGLRDGFVALLSRRRGMTVVAGNYPLPEAQELADGGHAHWRGDLLRASAGSGERASIPAAEVAPPGSFSSDPEEGRSGPAGLASAAGVRASDPLGLLARRRDGSGRPWLGPAALEAGRRYGRDVEIGRMAPSITVDWTRLGGGRAADGLQLSERALAARQRLARADRAVGRELAGVIWDICAGGRGPGA